MCSPFRIKSLISISCGYSVVCVIWNTDITAGYRQSLEASWSDGRGLRLLSFMGSVHVSTSRIQLNTANFNCCQFGNERFRKLSQLSLYTEFETSKKKDSPLCFPTNHHEDSELRGLSSFTGAWGHSTAVVPEDKNTAAI